MKAVYILWDASQIWGLLAVRAVRALGVPYALIRAADVAGGLLQREPAPLLLVPGGSAKQKAAALGEAGLAAVREYVAGGGNYLGFCGGAGLALSTADGLGICPRQRAAFGERLQHFMSGHLHVRLNYELCPDLLPKPTDGYAPGAVPGAPNTTHPDTVALPVWWPGRFESNDNDGVDVPATFAGPAEDFWLADLPIAAIPAGTFEAWKDLYGFQPTPSFLEGSPCMLTGTYGKGRYVLSYSHLETPDSPDAGRIFAHLLQRLSGAAPLRHDVPTWDLSQEPQDAPHPLPAQLQAICAPIFTLGQSHGLLFVRTPWLLGWRTGIPGANLNNLRAALHTACALPLHGEALAFAEAHGPEMLQAAQLFAAGCSEYLMTERLAQTLSKALPDILPGPMLNARREALFGAPMQPAGPFLALTAPLEELVFLQHRDYGEAVESPRL